MARTKRIIQLALTVLCFSCDKSIETPGNTLYFSEGELSEDYWSDSIMNRHYSEKLLLLNEPSLKDTLNENETIRLTVLPSFFNAYCIRLDKADSIFLVNFKILSDAQGYRLTGLNGLSLRYESDFSKMDTIYNDIKDAISQFNIFQHDNSTPKIVKQGK